MEAYLIDIGNVILGHIYSTPAYILTLEVFGVFAFMSLLDIVNVLLVMIASPKQKKGYSRIIKDTQRILVAGDSTAVGTGSKDPVRTLAGFLAKDFPMMSIENVAVNGTTTREVLTQLNHAEAERYEGILISTGGNDVWKFTPLTSLREDIHSVLTTSKAMCDGKVLFVFFGNEGSAPFFPTLFRKILMWRTRKVLALFREVANEHNVPLLELFTKEAENPFVKDPSTHFALDGLHPSQAGYWEWYKRLWRIIAEHEYHWGEKQTHRK